MWRILHLDLLVGERSGPFKLEVTRRHILGDDLMRQVQEGEADSVSRRTPRLKLMCCWSMRERSCNSVIHETV
ncbi:hypothetical protein ISN44_As09g009160 [Arabidopsis suecica]|uniref:Uncharacterized protein n=1 Tax=Arabidopsis suecica TaxID=45249 RepID=A0A8T2AHW1_ARASU|nr:hypothetical protein ISN44_As09g009160 [Arabidopsis suecica]KAG7572555.1 hypothetical protein ISN44_As09g009160 [Arabidopsis suecica]